MAVLSSVFLKNIWGFKNKLLSLQNETETNYINRLSVLPFFSVIRSGLAVC
jgi:hypothetical protein